MNAVVVAGGRARRLDGAVKPLLEVGGDTLLGHAVRAATDAGASPVVVAAPVLDPALDVVWVREEPAGGGPVAAIVAATAELDADAAWTLVLAADLPGARAAVARLAAALPLVAADVDGVCLGDPSSRPQWLIGAYRTRALLRAAEALPDGGRDLAVRDLTADLAITVLTAPDAETADVDTWEDLTAARARAGRVDGAPMSTLPPEALDEWAAALAERLGPDAAEVPIALVLDLARDVAHGVARPAAPLSAYIAGLVIGRSGRDPREVVQEITALAAEWGTR